jgi:putative transposase
MYGVATMCRVLAVSASGYYAWLKRPLSARARADAGLMSRLTAIHQFSRGTYGAPRIHEELSAAGIQVGRKRVARLMRAAGLRGVSRRRWISTTVRDRKARPASDLVERNFTAAAPDCLWVADITYIPTWAGFLYLAVVLDVFSRRIVGWAMAPHLRTELVLEALNMALGQRHPAAVIHHSDQGSQGEFKRSSQHSTEEKRDGHWKAAFRSMRARTIAVAGAASGSAAGTPPKVLGIDCDGPFNRGRCDQRRSVARGGWPVVPEGGRHDTGPLFAVFEASVGSLSSVCRARRDCHLAGSGQWRSGHCPQAWASAFDDLSRTASERCDPQRRTRISGHHRPMAC